MLHSAPSNVEVCTSPTSSTSTQLSSHKQVHRSISCWSSVFLFYCHDPILRMCFVRQHIRGRGRGTGAAVGCCDRDLSQDTTQQRAYELLAAAARGITDARAQHGHERGRSQGKPHQTRAQTSSPRITIRCPITAHVPTASMAHLRMHRARAGDSTLLCVVGWCVRQSIDALDGPYTVITALFLLLYAVSSLPLRHPGPRWPVGAMQPAQFNGTFMRVRATPLPVHAPSLMHARADLLWNVVLCFQMWQNCLAQLRGRFIQQNITCFH